MAKVSDGCHSMCKGRNRNGENAEGQSAELRNPVCGDLRSAVILHKYDRCLLPQKSSAVHRQFPLCSSLSIL